MKKMTKKLTAAVCIMALVVSGLTGCGKKEEEKTTQKAFVPSLDTTAKVSLETAGFMGNFEAFDQVVNDFNKYYPNVTINYEQNNGYELAEYLKNNQYVDIFMTNDDNVRAEGTEPYVQESCLDLSKENLDTSAMDPKLIEAGTVDGKLVRIPLTRNMCGMVVNKNILKKEGIEIPKTYSEFLEACKKLKERGYTPIQASQYHAYSDMMLPMAMVQIGSDKKLMDQVNKADAAAAANFKTMFEHLDEICQNGYTNQKINETYPDDNYDGAILKFFEGNVPFWICTTECVSGMKKRESKSEKFTKEPFEYEFMFVPLSEEGVYDYEEPWYGFSVNKNSDQLDYAVEFMRFLLTEQELNQMAQVKGMPSAAVNSSDSRYASVHNPEKKAGHYIYDGQVISGITSAISDTCNKYGRGEFKDTDAAVEALGKRFAELNNEGDSKKNE